MSPTFNLLPMTPRPQKQVSPQKSRVTQKSAIQGPEQERCEQSSEVYDQLLLRAANDPVSAALYVQEQLTSIENAFVKSKKENDENTLHWCAVAYAAATSLVQSEEMWSRFTEALFWKDYDGQKPHRQKSKNHLKWMMRYVFRVSDRRSKDRVNVYHGALEEAFDHKTDAAMIIDIVHSNGGIDELYRRNLNRKAAERKARRRRESDLASPEPRFEMETELNDSGNVEVQVGGVWADDASTSKSESCPNPQFGNCSPGQAGSGWFG